MSQFLNSINLEKTKKGIINNVFTDFYLRVLDLSIGQIEGLGLRKPQGKQLSHDSIIKISVRRMDQEALMELFIYEFIF